MKQYTRNRTQKLRSKPNRFFYDGKILSQLSPNSRIKFMSLKNRASHRQLKKDNDNRNNILYKQYAFRELISSKNTTKKKSYVKKPSLHTIMESNSPALYTSNISELSPNTRKLFLDHKQISKKRASLSGNIRPLSNKTRGKTQTKSRHRNKGTKKRLKTKI
jgi:hypothetical protein